MDKAAHLIIYCLLCVTYVSASSEEWTGRWFPDGMVETVKDVKDNDLSYLRDDKHGIKMGVKDKNCDDGQNRIAIDYDGSPVNYTCYEDKALYQHHQFVANPLLEHDYIPKSYHALHFCLDTQIFYNHEIPTYGAHRPLWPLYGEYTFVPIQRYLHNLEHGAIVMLYHPCANSNEVNKMKNKLRSCVYKHIISANSNLKPDRPFALLAWGHRLLLPEYYEDIMVDFIRRYADKGPEKTNKNGQYSLGLIKNATQFPIGYMC